MSRCPNTGFRGRGAVAAVLLSVAVATACGDEPMPQTRPPGTNVTVDDIAIRYAHLEDPPGPDGWQPGDDVPFYVWLVNESGEAAALTAASSPIAASVTPVQGAFPLDLPQGELVQLGPDGAHLVLRDIDRQVRGAEFVPVTLTLSDGRVAELDVEAIDVDTGSLD